MPRKGLASWRALVKIYPAIDGLACMSRRVLVPLLVTALSASLLMGGARARTTTPEPRGLLQLAYPRNGPRPLPPPGPAVKRPPDRILLPACRRGMTAVRGPTSSYSTALRCRYHLMWSWRRTAAPPRWSVKWDRFPIFRSSPAAPLGHRRRGGLRSAERPVLGGICAEPAGQLLRVHRPVHHCHRSQRAGIRRPRGAERRRTPNGRFGSKHRHPHRA